MRFIEEGVRLRRSMPRCTGEKILGASGPVVDLSVPALKPSSEYRTYLSKAVTRSSTPMPPHYVIVTGGVLSGLGKGVATASLGALFGMMGLRCTLKLDPYLNVDPGTMNPVEHGEVFVTHDGAETDLDLGYYERFAGIRATKANSTSSGQLFQRLLERERKGDFLGKTVQMVPHFTDELQAFIERDADAYDVVLCEIGGSVGDIEAMAFYEALCRLRTKVGPARFVLVHLCRRPLLGLE